MGTGRIADRYAVVERDEERVGVSVKIISSEHGDARAMEKQ